MEPFEWIRKGCIPTLVLIIAMSWVAFLDRLGIELRESFRERLDLNLRLPLPRAK